MRNHRARWSRWARLLVVALVSGVGISIIVLAVADWHLRDMEVYAAAAWRLRDGQALYGGDVDELSAYRYAPWFAYARVPLTWLAPRRSRRRSTARMTASRRAVRIGLRVLSYDVTTFLAVRPDGDDHLTVRVAVPGWRVSSS